VSGGSESRAQRAAPAWPDVLATALIGTARAGGRPEALLDAAATHALRRRAGLAPVRPEGSVSPPAPADDRAPVGPAAAARAGDLLAFDHSGRDAAPVRDVAGRLELLTEWLAAAEATGRRLPAELVPALLDAGRRHHGLRRYVAPVAGPLAGWLATQRPDWAYAVARPGPGGVGPAPPAGLAGAHSSAVDGDADQRTWEYGDPGQRVAALRRLRRRDSDRARDLLAAGWDEEPPDDRPALLGVLADGLADGDEPLLERALDDRRRPVRELAADLLGRLPGSGYARRMADRVDGCVRVGERRVEITPPDACDRAMRRDGIAARPPAGTGSRAWWLEEIVARTPLRHWPAPEAFLARAVAEEWAIPLRRGLARAAAGQRDGGWAAALTDRLVADVAAHDRPEDRLLLEALYDALPPADLADRAVAALRRGLADAHAVGVEHILALCPGPWPRTVAEAVLAAVADQLLRGGGAWRVTGLCELGALRLPADLAPHARALADRLRTIRPTDPGVAAVERLAAVLRFRHDLHEELA
jgi:hypothetical protein